MHAVGLVLHPKRDSEGAVNAVLDWAAQNGTEVLGIAEEIVRLHCAATAVTAEELARRSDLLVSLGGDGTMLRAMRLADRQRAPVLGREPGQAGLPGRGRRARPAGGADRHRRAAISPSSRGWPSMP